MGRGGSGGASPARRRSISRCISAEPYEQAQWASWRGIRIRNWHRPLSTYMALLLEQNLQLRYFAEPAPTGGDPAKAERYRRVSYFLVMEWLKPG